MKIQVYAKLKDYFEREFEVNTPLQDIAALKQHLSEINPEAENVLELCRFAVQNEFVENTYQLDNNETISIIPPSSGG